MKNEYDLEADKFCEQYGLVIHADYTNSGRCPPWCRDNEHVHGDHYHISIMRKDSDEVLEFDYWNSQVSKDKGERPSNYEILACVSHQALMPEDPLHVIHEMGDMKLDRAQKIAEEGERFRQFFSVEEMGDLVIIQ